MIIKALQDFNRMYTESQKSYIKNRCLTFFSDMFFR